MVNLIIPVNLGILVSGESAHFGKAGDFVEFGFLLILLILMNILNMVILVIMVHVVFLVNLIILENSYHW